jgi:hypothetical protein
MRSAPRSQGVAARKDVVWQLAQIATQIVENADSRVATA